MRDALLGVLGSLSRLLFEPLVRSVREGLRECEEDDAEEEEEERYEERLRALCTFTPRSLSLRRDR